MTDVAKLGYEIDSSQAVRAEKNLNSMSSATRKAESASQRAERSINDLVKQFQHENRLLERGASLEQARTRSRLKSEGATVSQIKEIERLKSEQEQLVNQQGRLGKSYQRVAESARHYGRIASGITFAAAGAGIVASIKQFADFEERLIQVGKTADLEGERLQELGERVQMIGRSVAVPTERLLELAGAAGQLGVKGVDNISRFAETLGKLETATDVAGEEGARSLARLLNITGDGVENVDRLGSALTALGNNFATTEQEIIQTSTFLGAATQQYDLTSSEVVGLSAALRSLGQRAETSGSAVGAALAEIDTAISTGNEGLRTLIDLTGMSAQELEAAFRDNATGVLLDFADALNDLPTAEQTAVLDQFNLAGRETRRVIGAVASDVDMVRRALTTANDEWTRNEALNIEAAKASESFKSQIQFLGNALNEAAVDIGRELAPVVLDLTRKFRDFIQEASDSGQLESFFEDVGEAAEDAIDSIEPIVTSGYAIGKSFELAGVNLGGFAATLGALVSGEFSRAADIQKLILEDSERIESQIAAAFSDDNQSLIDGTADSLGGVKERTDEALESLSKYGILVQATADAEAADERREFTAALAETGSAAEDAAEDTDKLTAAQKEAREAARQAEQSYSDLRDELELENEVLRIRLEQGEEAAEAFREEALLRERLNEIRGETNVIGETEIDQTVRLQETNRELNEQLENREQAEREATRAAERAAEERARIAEREAEAFQRPFENAAENIQRSFGDMFTDIYRGGTNIFEDFAGTIKDIFARLAGEITALFLTRGLGQLLGVGGGISVSGSALASGGGLLGELGGGLGGLTDLAASIPGIGQVLDVAQAFQAGFQNTGVGGGIQAAIDQSFLSAPTSVGGGLLAAGAGGFGGYTAGNFLNSLGLTQGGGTGSGIGGGIGGAIGSFAGPLGTVAGSLGGSFIGGGIEELLSGETFADRVTGALDAFFPGVGSILDGVLSGFESLFGSGGDLINIAPVTRAGDSLSNIEGPVLRDGPFGNVGLSRQYGRGEIPGDVIRNLTQSVADFDQQVSEFLTQSQIGDVSSFLQSQDIGLGLGAGSGTGFGQGVDDEDIADLLANRFSQIFDALDLRLPDVVEKATRNKLDDLGISTEQVLEAGLAPLAQLQAQREAAAEQVRNAVGAGEAGQTIQDVFDELSIATDQLPRTREELTAFVEGLNETEQAGLAPIIGQLQQFVSTSEQAQQRIEQQALAVQREFGLADSAFQEYLQTLGTSTDQLPRTEQGLQDFIAGLDEAEQAGLQPFIGELRALVQASGEATDATQSAAEAARIDAREQELQIELLRAQGKEEQALAAERQLQLENTPEQLRAIQEQIFAARDQTQAQQEAARAAEEQAAAEQRLAEQRQSLEVQLARAQGDDELARQLQRESTLAGLPEELRELQQEIFAAEDAARQAVQEERELAEARREAARIADQRSRLEIELLRAQGNEEAALAAERERQLDQLPESLRAIQEQIFAARDQAAANQEAARAAEEQAAAARQLADQRARLEVELARAQGDDELARSLEREQILSGLPDALKDLQQAIFDAEDASRSAAEAEQRRAERQRRLEEARQEAARIADQRSRLEIELLRAQGEEQAALNLERQRQIEQLPASLQALQEQIFSAQDAAQAQEELARAQEEAAQRAREAARFTDDIETRLAASQLSGTDLELFRLDNEFDDLRDQATELGVDLADIEELYAIRRTEILEQAAQEQQQVVEQGVQDATATLREAYDRQASELQSTVERFTGFGDSLRAFREDLVGGDIARLTGQQRLERERGQFAEVAELAALGDEQALQNIERAGREFLEASSDVNATSEAFFADRDRVLQAIESATGAADFEADLAQSQLDTLRDQVSELITINESVVSVEEAIQQFRDAEAALGGVTESGGETPTVNVQTPPNQQAQQQRNTDSLISELRTSNAELRQQNEHLAATVRILQRGFQRTTEQGDQIVENTGETARAARLETS